MKENHNDKEDPVWSILPSYDMHQNAFNKSADPPQYGEDTSATNSTYSHSFGSTDTNNTDTANSFNEYNRNLSGETTHEDRLNPGFIVADGSTSTWKETLLDNIDKLRTCSSSISKSVKLSVHFTEDVGQSGVVPRHIDPLQSEYKQGDFLNGYIFIQNMSDSPIPFDLFYVLFEGSFTIMDTDHTGKKTAVKYKRFLEMYDFAASWNHSIVDRLLSAPISDQITCPGQFDALDGSRLCMLDKKLMPGVLYKRFFTFKIPEQLLDTACNEHQLSSHTKLPPTLGFRHRDNSFDQVKFGSSDDFSFVGSSTNYGVSARFIGKSSYYGEESKVKIPTTLVDETGEEFIILTDHTSFVRVIQESRIKSTSEKLLDEKMSRVLYENLLGRIKEKTDLGYRIKRERTSGHQGKEAITLFRSAEGEETTAGALKAGQIYTSFENTTKDAGSQLEDSRNYEILVHVTKSKLIGAAKFMGTLSIKSPKTEYILNYMSPKRFRNGPSDKAYSWKLEVPIEVSFTPANLASGIKVPHITKLSTELVVFSVKSSQGSIPIEFTHDHLFRNESSELVGLKSNDNIENIVIKPMAAYAVELCQLIKECGTGHLKVENSLFEDISSLASLKVKRNNLDLRGSGINGIGGCEIKCERSKPIELAKNDGMYTSQFTVVMDAAKVQKKGYNMANLSADHSSVDEFCLVPSFQNCTMARMYYLRIIMGFSTGHMIELKLPLTIVKTPSV